MMGEEIEEIIIDGEMREALQNLEKDYGNLGVGIELVERELGVSNPSNDKLKKLIVDLELWVKTMRNNICYLDDARVVFHKRRIVDGLELKW